MFNPRPCVRSLSLPPGLYRVMRTSGSRVTPSPRAALIAGPTWPHPVGLRAQLSFTLHQFLCSIGICGLGLDGGGGPHHTTVAANPVEPAAKFFFGAECFLCFWGQVTRKLQKGGGQGFF